MVTPNPVHLENLSLVQKILFQFKTKENQTCLHCNNVRKTPDHSRIIADSKLLRLHKGMQVNALLASGTITMTKNEHGENVQETSNLT